MSISTHWAKERLKDAQRRLMKEVLIHVETDKLIHFCYNASYEQLFELRAAIIEGLTQPQLEKVCNLYYSPAKMRALRIALSRNVTPQEFKKLKKLEVSDYCFLDIAIGLKNNLSFSDVMAYAEPGLADWQIHYMRLMTQSEATAS